MKRGASRVFVFAAAAVLPLNAMFIQGIAGRRMLDGGRSSPAFAPDFASPPFRLLHHLTFRLP